MRSWQGLQKAFPEKNHSFSSPIFLHLDAGMEKATILAKDTYVRNELGHGNTSSVLLCGVAPN